MPLVIERKQVEDIYSEMAQRKWVLPAFNAENLSTCEAILDATRQYGDYIGIANLPIIIGITNNYRHRPQSVYYTHTKQWALGVALFLNDLKILTQVTSPFKDLRVMVHLDHIQWDADWELLNWDMNQFSSIMYDASTLPLDQNIVKTAVFVEQHKDKILIEGACDEIGKSSSSGDNKLTTPVIAEKYYQETAVDILVANLGTEHRASSASLKYHDQLALEITRRIGPKLCLHGTSSISLDKLKRLFDHGIRRVNIWTTLERDSTPLLFQNMVKNASKVVGSKKVKDLIDSGWLGKKTDCISSPSLDYFTTSYRQNIIFKKMKNIVTRYLKIWYKI